MHQQSTDRISLKKGFTLIELSIVLVIISLIVGGIIGGKSLLRSAEIREILTTLNKYQVAVNTFSLQYDALPGDFSEAQSYWPSCVDEASNICNGNNDGKINNNSAREPVRAWQHLALSGIIEGAYNGLYVSPAIENITYPRGTGQGSYYLMLNRTMYGHTENFVELFPEYNGSAHNTDTVNGREAKSMDKKVDDGVGYTGKMLIWKVPGTGCMDVIGLRATSANFVLDDDERNCMVSYQLQ